MRTVTDSLKTSMIEGSSYRAFAKLELKKTRVSLMLRLGILVLGHLLPLFKRPRSPTDVCYSPTVGALVTAYVDELKSN